MFATGAGVAPMRAMIQEKLRLNSLGIKNNYGLMSLFFGTKTDKDFLFKGEFETAAKLGALNELKVAFSRQPVNNFFLKKLKGQKKVYIQHLIYENKSTIIDYIIKGQGVIYVCGNTGLKKGVIDQLDKIFDERNMIGYTKQLIKEKRLNIECWG